MTSIYEGNIDCIKKFNKSAAEMLLRRSEEPSLYEAQVQNNVLSIKDDQGHSAVYDKSIQVKFDKYPPLVLLNGFGDGQLVSQFLNLKGVLDVVVYEPQVDILNQILQVKDFSKLLSERRLSFVVGHHEQDLFSQLNNFFQIDRVRVASIEESLQFTTPMTDVFPESKQAYQKFVRIWQEGCKFQLTRDMMAVEDEYLGLLNTLRNFKDYFSSTRLSDVKGIHKGKIGVVVATGPSLRHSLEFLKKHQEDVVICAVDSALCVLQQEGIRADYVSSLERAGAIAFLFQGMEPAPNTHLIAPAVLVPEAFKAFLGPKLQMYRSVGYENWVTEVGDEPLMIGSSSSHVAMVALHHLGCETILVLGQDCCYDPFSGKSHDMGTKEYVLAYGEQEKTSVDGVAKLEVVGNDGQMKLTTGWWHSFNLMYSELISYRGFPKVYNVIPKEYGIPIRFTEQIEPAVAFSTLLKGPCDKKHDKSQIPTETLSLDYGKNKLSGIKKCLDDLNHQCLVIMQEISIFWMDHDVHVTGQNMEQKYKQFFLHQEKAQQSLYEMNDGFFEEYFLKMILTRHSEIGTELEKLRYEKDIFKSVNRRVELIYDWYKEVHHWSSRAMTLIDSQNLF